MEPYEPQEIKALLDRLLTAMEQDILDGPAAIVELKASEAISEDQARKLVALSLASATLFGAVTILLEKWPVMTRAALLVAYQRISGSITAPEGPSR